MGADTAEQEEDCSGTAPVISSLTAEPIGLVEYEQGVSYPTLRFDLVATDADSDLSYLSYEIWWDEDMDGTVDVEAESMGVGELAISDTRCETPQANVLIDQPAAGIPAPNTWYDFAFRVYDEAQMMSVPAYVQAAPPKKDGSDPDPYEPGDTGAAR